MLSSPPAMAMEAAAKASDLRALHQYMRWRDRKPIMWIEEEREKGQAWELKTIESFHTHGTPPA